MEREQNPLVFKWVPLSPLIPTLTLSHLSHDPRPRQPGIGFELLGPIIIVNHALIIKISEARIVPHQRSGVFPEGGVGGERLGWNGEQKPFPTTVSGSSMIIWLKPPSD